MRRGSLTTNGRRRRSRRSAALLAFALCAACGGGSTPPAVTLIGVDGATWDAIDPMLAAGELPNLARLVERGARAPLRTYYHPRSEFKLRVGSIR